MDHSNDSRDSDEEGEDTRLDEWIAKMWPTLARHAWFTPTLLLPPPLRNGIPHMLEGRLAFDGPWLVGRPAYCTAAVARDVYRMLVTVGQNDPIQAHCAEGIVLIRRAHITDTASSESRFFEAACVPMRAGESLTLDFLDPTDETSSVLILCVGGTPPECFVSLRHPLDTTRRDTVARFVATPNMRWPFTTPGSVSLLTPPRTFTGSGGQTSRSPPYATLWVHTCGAHSRQSSSSSSASSSTNVVMTARSLPASRTSSPSRKRTLHDSSDQVPEDLMRIAQLRLTSAGVPIERRLPTRSLHASTQDASVFDEAMAMGIYINGTAEHTMRLSACFSHLQPIYIDDDGGARIVVFTPRDENVVLGITHRERYDTATGRTNFFIHIDHYGLAEARPCMVRRSSSSRASPELGVVPLRMSRSRRDSPVIECSLFAVSDPVLPPMCVSSGSGELDVDSSDELVLRMVYGRRVRGFTYARYVDEARSRQRRHDNDKHAVSPYYLPKFDGE